MRLPGGIPLTIRKTRSLSKERHAMPEHKNGGASRAAAKRTTSASSETSPRSHRRSEYDDTAPAMPARRKRQYLIGVRPVISFAQQPADAIHDALNHIEDIEILRRLRRRGLQGLGATALPGEQEVVVVRMDEKRAEALRQSAPLHVLIEQDVRLSTGQGLLPIPFAAPWFGGNIPSTRGRKERRFYIF